MECADSDDENDEKKTEEENDEKKEDKDDVTQEEVCLIETECLILGERSEHFPRSRFMCVYKILCTIK